MDLLTSNRNWFSANVLSRAFEVNVRTISKILIHLKIPWHTVPGTKLRRLSRENVRKLIDGVHKADLLP